MKKRLTTIWILMLLLVSSCDTTLNIEPSYESHFVKYFGGKGDQEARDMVTVSDGYILLGSSDSDLLGKQVLIIKTDFLGNTIWTRNYGGIYNEDPQSIGIAPSGEFVISSTLNYPDATSDIKVHLLASDGSKTDSLIYGDPNFSEFATDAIALVNGDYIILGTTTNVPAPLVSAIVVLRTEPNSLNLLPEASWRRVHGEGDNDSAAEVVEVFDIQSNSYEYYVLGTSNSNQASNYDMLIFSLDETGEQINVNFWGTDDNDIAGSLIKLESGFGLFGTTTNGASNNYLFQQVGPSLMNRSAIITGERPNIIGRDIIDIGTAYIIIGTEIIGVEDTNIYLAKIDKLFPTVYWETTFGGTELDEAASGLYLDADGGIVFLATVDLESQTKMALIKVNPEGLLNQ